MVGHIQGLLHPTDHSKPIFKKVELIWTTYTNLCLLGCHPTYKGIVSTQISPTHT